jgi:RNA polymerase sigma factor (TIGR02999 family)
MAGSDACGDITELLVEWSRGSQVALDRLMPIVYARLRQLADSSIRRERPDHTLRATALVHEAYLKLVDQQRVRWQDRAHFFGVAAQMMRRILVDHARRHRAAKRGGDATRVAIDEAGARASEGGVDVIALHELLERLERVEPRQSRVVELRFFAGLTVEETAEVLGVSPATIKSDWRIAKAWLYAELNGEPMR